MRKYCNFKLRLRDLHWFFLVLAIALAWWHDHARLDTQLDTLFSHPEYRHLSQLITQMELDIMGLAADSPQRNELRIHIDLLKRRMRGREEELKAGIPSVELDASGPTSAVVGDVVELIVSVDPRSNQPVDALARAVHGLGLEPIGTMSDYIPEYGVFRWSLKGLRRGSPFRQRLRYKCTSATSRTGVTFDVRLANGTDFCERVPITIIEQF